MRTNPARSSEGLYLGLECGATRTVALLADEENRPRGRMEAGPANLRLMSDAALQSLLRSVSARFPQPTAVGIGMAGAMEEGERRRIYAAASLAWPGLLCWAGSDLDTALAAAEVGGAGRITRVIIICGTGSCCYGRNPEGRTAKVGGWGHVLDDRGSGYDLGVQALRGVMRGYDRTGRVPPLGQHFLRALMLNTPNDLVTWAQRATKPEMATLAVDVFEAAAKGDTLARQTIRGAVEYLVGDALICGKRLTRWGAPIEFVLSGGVFRHQPGFAQNLTRGLRKAWPGAIIHPLRQEGAWGAVAHARSLWLHRSGKRTETRPASITKAPAAPASEEALLPASTTLSPTEQRNPRSRNLHRMSLSASIKLMLSEDARVPAALLRERRKIEAGVRLIVKAFRRGGRLFYVGAGTSGRLGVLDASECPPTFRTPPDLVQGIMAGGQSALWSSIEGAEDEAGAGEKAARLRGVRAKDVVVGIAASGRTPFVWGAFKAARELGAATILLCFNPHLKIDRAIEPTLVLAPEVGPEILTGSTRLKAGTATKLVLNIFTTLAMVQLGKVESNFMIDMNPSNTKLRDRATRMVMELTNAKRDKAAKTLEASRWVIRKALGRLKS